MIRNPFQSARQLVALSTASFVLACFLFLTPAHAAQTVPYLINFQGRLANASGTVLSGSYDMQFKLYTAVTGGTYVWGETRTTANSNAVTVTNGLFSVLIGQGTAVAGSSASLQAAVTANMTLYMEVTVGAEVLSPRSQFGASAFSINSDMLDGQDSSAFAPASGSTNYAPISGSTNYAPISGSANYIQNGSSQQASSNFNISGNGTIGGVGTVTGNFTNNGAALFKNTTNSTSAFSIQTSASANLFVADTTNARIYVGDPAGDANAVLLVLDNKNTTGDPASGTAGAMYYNSADGDYRAYQNSGWATVQPVRYAYLSSVVSQTTTTYADVTGMTFSVAANTNYEVSCSIIYQTAATTTGIGISLNGPASPTLIAGQFISNSTATALNGRSFNAYNGTGKTTGVTTANANTYGLFSASFRNGATAGTLALRYASEVAGSSVSIRPGSYCRVTEL